MGVLFKCGIMNVNAKLTDESVREIRQLRSEGWVIRRLAARYNVTIGAVIPVIRRKTWRHVPDVLPGEAATPDVR